MIYLQNDIFLEGMNNQVEIISSWIIQKSTVSFFMHVITNSLPSQTMVSLVLFPLLRMLPTRDKHIGTRSSSASIKCHPFQLRRVNCSSFSSFCSHTYLSLVLPFFFNCWVIVCMTFQFLFVSTACIKVKSSSQSQRLAVVKNRAA